MESAWYEGDPREAVEKRGIIAICVDQKVFGGRVETKHSWSVFLHPNHLDRNMIGPEDSWPMGWRWVQVPNTRRKA